MRSLTRAAATLAALAAIAALGAMPVAAGNFAEVTMIPAAGDPPAAGEEQEFRFILLQHGVTPVDHGQVQLNATLDGSRETISVIATSLGDGEWMARLTLPVEGEWQLRVTHSEFETSPATAIEVGATGFMLPAGMPVIIGLALAVTVVGLMLLIGRRRRPMRPEPASVATRMG